MILEIAFVFTAAMLITAAFKFVGLIFGNDMNLPVIGIDFAPDHFVVFYPSLLFQVWFWTDKLGVLV